MCVKASTASLGTCECRHILQGRGVGRQSCLRGRLRKTLLLVGVESMRGATVT